MGFEDLKKDKEKMREIRERLSFITEDELNSLKYNDLVNKEMFDMLKSLKASVPDAMKKNEGMHRVGMIGGLERLNYFKTMPESVASYVNYNGPKIQNELAPHLEEMKNPSFAASQIAGNIVKEVYGVQPVFVTNWPKEENKELSALEMLQTVASIVATIDIAVKWLIPLLRNGWNAATSFGSRAATGFIPLIIIGTPEMYEERLNFGLKKRMAKQDGGERSDGFLLAFAGLDLTAQFRALRPDIGGLNYLAEILSPYAGDARDREITHDEPEKPMFESLTGFAVEGGYKAFNMLDGMFSAFADIFSPKQAFAYDMGALNNIGNYHGDSMRGLTDSAPETLAPQIKVTVNQPPIQNKVKGYDLFSGDSLLSAWVALLSFIASLNASFIMAACSCISDRRCLRRARWPSFNSSIFAGRM